MRRSDFTPFLGKFMSSLILFIAIFIHIELVYAILRFIFYNYFKKDISFNIDNLIWLSVFLIMFLLIFKYYNKNRISYLVEKYQNKRIFSFSNIVKFFCIIFIPLVIAIILVNQSVSK
jgi:hypothetical protein